MGNDGYVDRLAPKRPRSFWERIFGIVGGVATVAWIFQVCLRVIDAISRVQTLMAVEPYVHYLLTWWAQLIELGAAVTFIVLATRIEHSRETEDAPRIILLETREPTPPKRDWLWMKVAGAGILFAALAAGCVFLVVKPSGQAIRSARGADLAQKSNSPQTNAAQASKPDREKKSFATNPRPKNVTPTTLQNKSTTQSRPSQSVPVTIPVPDKPVASRPTSGKSSVKYVAAIDGQVVQANSKLPGMLTVSLGVTSNSRYLGKISPTDVDNVAEALKKTGKISLFLNKSPGSYSIRGNDLAYSLSITQIHPETIYFFDTRLESACTALKTIISSIVGQVNCKFTPVQPSSDPNEPNVQYDFLTQSGLDMEVDL